MLEWEIVGTMHVVPARRGRPTCEGGWRRPPDTRAPPAVAAAALGARLAQRTRALGRGVRVGHSRGKANDGWVARGVSHLVLEGKPNANHVRVRISNSRTQQLHNRTSSHSARIIT
jgi:predicted chitinase